MRKYQKDSIPPQSSLGFFNKTGFTQASAFSKSGAGFTLIELLIVIAVLGVLAAGLLVLINPAGQMAKARDAGRKSALKQVASALDSYAIDHNGQYPPSPAYCTGNPLISAAADNWIPPEISYQLKTVPIDPKGNDCWPFDDAQGARTYGYAYMQQNSGLGYILITGLENTSDTQINGSQFSGLGWGTIPNNTYVFILPGGKYQ